MMKKNQETNRTWRKSSSFWLLGRNPEGLVEQQFFQQMDENLPILWNSDS